MHRRVTPLPVAALALLASAALASAAFACGDAGKTAAAMPSCCSAKARTTACAAPAAKPAACAATSATALVAPAPAAAPFAALPNFMQPTPIVSGLMAFLDPETGLLSGPIGSLQAPEDLTRAFAAPLELTPVTLPGGGGVMIDLQGSLMDNYVLTIDPLGRRAIRCVQNAKDALAPAAPIMPTPLTISPISER